MFSLSYYLGKDFKTGAKWHFPLGSRPASQSHIQRADRDGSGAVVGGDFVAVCKWVIVGYILFLLSFNDMQPAACNVWKIKILQINCTRAILQSENWINILVPCDFFSDIRTQSDMLRTWNFLQVWQIFMTNNVDN